MGIIDTRVTGELLEDIQSGSLKVIKVNVADNDVDLNVAGDRGRIKLTIPNAIIESQEDNAERIIIAGARVTAIRDVDWHGTTYGHLSARVRAVELDTNGSVTTIRTR